MMEQTELPPSRLGTKDYWDSAYQNEIENFENHGDVGEVWFGEDSAYRIIRWMSNSDLVTKDQSVIDVGCGNGMMLIELAEDGYTNLTGVDYSSQAIELAKKIAQKKGFESIKYSTCDIINNDLCKEETYSVVLDKGTYDAISLNPENASAQREIYKAKVKQLVKSNGLFIICSCNWTEEELKQHFNSDFYTSAVIPAPTFQFGGKVGSSVTTIVFQPKCIETL